jgi:glycosyltransferase involved in cell wall biosynthesis
MRILVLDEWIPYPLISGKRLRSYHLLTRAAQNHDITYLCFQDAHGEEDARNHLESRGLRTVTLRRKNPFVPSYRLYAHAAANLFSQTPLVMRKHFRHDYLARMKKLLLDERFDLIHCEWMHYGAYVRDLDDHPLFLSSHNIEAMPWKRLYAHEKNPLKRAALYLEWKKMDAFEHKVSRRFHHVGAVSEDDGVAFREVYGCDSVAVIPNGIDVGYYDFETRGTGVNTLVFSASFDAFVNQDAVVYWMESIFPRILSKVPDVKMCFLGKDPPRALTRYASDRVSFTGTVPDVRPRLSRAGVCVVPIRVAGGSRIKILEAMAAGLPVVSTPEGAEGLDVVPGEHLLIARGEEEFAVSVVELLRNGEVARSMAWKARKLVEQHYDWGKIAPLLEEAWETTLQRFATRRTSMR